jgi:signal peptidase I
MWAAAGAGLAVAGCAVLWVRRALVLVTVTGESMEPTLRAGDRVLVRRRRAHQLARGDVVVLAPPRTRVRAGDRWRVPSEGWNIKRVAALPGDAVPDGVPDPDGTGLVPPGTLVVLSDNPIGVDSRLWGPYPAGGVIGTPVRVRPAEAVAAGSRA